VRKFGAIVDNSSTDEGRKVATATKLQDEPEQAPKMLRLARAVHGVCD